MTDTDNYGVWMDFPENEPENNERVLIRRKGFGQLWEAAVYNKDYECWDDGDVYRNMVFHLKGKYIIQYPRLTTLWPSLLSVEAVNIIDACVEMIIKLHELKML